MTAFDELMAFERDTQALGQIAGRLGWDQETMMPRGAAPQRGEEMAAIEAVLHARRSDPRVADWLAAAVAPDEVGKAQLREIRRSYERTVKVLLKVLRRRRLLESNPVLANSITLRNPYIDPLNYLQIRFLREWRSELARGEPNDELERLLALTAHGIAFGMKSTG